MCLHRHFPPGISSRRLPSHGIRSRTIFLFGGKLRVHGTWIRQWGLESWGAWSRFAVLDCGLLAMHHAIIIRLYRCIFSSQCLCLMREIRLTACSMCGRFRSCDTWVYPSQTGRIIVAIICSRTKHICIEASMPAGTRQRVYGNRSVEWRFATRAVKMIVMWRPVLHAIVNLA